MNKINKLFKIHDKYYNENKSSLNHTCNGCRYEHTATCGNSDERIDECLNSLKRNTGIDYSYLVLEDAD